MVEKWPQMHFSTDPHTALFTTVQARIQIPVREIHTDDSAHPILLEPPAALGISYVKKEG